MTTKRFNVIIEIEADEGAELPTDEQVCSALSHSTAAEALAEALRGTVSMWMPNPEPACPANPS